MDLHILVHIDSTSGSAAIINIVIVIVIVIVIISVIIFVIIIITMDANSLHGLRKPSIAVS
jgi:hypothetical protein